MPSRFLPLPADLAVRLQHIVAGLEDRVITTRRKLHEYPEQGFTEFRTAALVARELDALGYQVRIGADAIAADQRLGVPPMAEVEAAFAAAREHGADEQWLEPMRGGLTAVIADLETGRPGPTVAFRFDMDALPINEASGGQHLPAARGFVSRRPGSMHACGHDGHTAIGLALAAVVVELAKELKGQVRLIFQPSEEGGRGGLAMVEAGACQGVDHLICLHLGLGVPGGEVVGGAVEFLASTRFIASIAGTAAHAGLAPEAGRSALLAAAQAALALHSLPQHSGGRTRINAGILRAGVAANIVAPAALLEFETRSDKTEINTFLEERALRALAGAAATFECDVETAVAGRTLAVDSDAALAALVADEAARLDGVRQAHLHRPFGASEDATFLMADVMARGGRATYAILGTDLAAAHHNERFDFDEQVLPLGVRLLAGVLCRLAGAQAGDVA